MRRSMASSFHLHQRIARGLWHCSWPARFIGILKDVATAANILTELREDEAAFAALGDQPSLGSHVALLHKRHVFQQRVVKQLTWLSRSTSTSRPAT